MKTRIILSLLLLATLVLSACQPAAPAEPAQPEAGQQQGYPAPQQELATDKQPEPGSKAVLYPDPKDGEEVTWGMAQAMILNGEVAKILERKDFKVVLSLKDGRNLTALQPSLEEAARIIKECGDKCKNIEVTKE